MIRRHLAATIALAWLSLAGCTNVSVARSDGSDDPKVADAISSRRLKDEIVYVSPSELEQLTEAVLKVRLATFRYKQGDKARHLGFIIEDSPDIPASDMARSRVDLYAYTSMAVAALQIQARQIEQLEADVDALSNEIEAVGGRRQSSAVPSSTATIASLHLRDEARCP